MFIGTFLCASGFVYLLTLFFGLWLLRGDTAVHSARHLVSRFTVRAWLLSILGLITFIGLSSWRGIIQFGVARSFSIPQDYIAAGIAGWLILLIGIFSAISPAVAWWWTTTDTKEK